MNALANILRQPVSRLLRLACFFGVAALVWMMASVIWPRPLLVISALSVGHGLGLLAFACYLLAVVLDTRRRDER